MVLHVCFVNGHHDTALTRPTVERAKSTLPATTLKGRLSRVDSMLISSRNSVVGFCTNFRITKSDDREQNR